MAVIKVKILKKILKIISQNLLPVALSIILFTLSFLTYQIIILDKFYPLTYLGNVNISFLTPKQASLKFDPIFNDRLKSQLEFAFGEDTFHIDLATSSAKISYAVLYEEFDNTHQGIFWQKVKMQFTTLFDPPTYIPPITLSLTDQLDTIAQAVDKDAQNAQLIFDESPNEASPSARIQIVEGKDGTKLDKKALQEEILNYLTFGDYSLQLPAQIIHPKITTQHVQKAKQALEDLQTESIKLKFAGSIWVIDTKQLLALLDLQSGENLLLDKDKTYLYLKNIASEIDQEVQEGLFEFNPNTRRVTAFKASAEGRKMDIDKTYLLLTEALTQEVNKTINLPVSIVKPKINTSAVNNLGIKELIGRGISNFAGSIQNRIYNINLAASRINGVLIAPGEEFSFNEKVGDISASSGYKPAYVIKQGRTVLDDGGGVCQDSTTLFRAILNAGLPVVQRVAHAYRVGFYEQGFPPGLDATVWAPSVDFKFKNDTAGHILIQAYTAGNTLYVDLYGTSDGRYAILSKPLVTDRTPAPEPLYQDDPTLPRGTTKQVDWAAQGAKVKFTRSVFRNGEEITKETWNSFYKPWQAVYLVGTKEN